MRKQSRTRSGTTMAFAIALALLAVACGDDGETAAPTETTAPAAGGETTPTSEDGAATEVQTGPGVDENEIRVAVLNDFSGPIASIGTPSAIGSEVFFEQLNAEGGVCGRDVTVVREDTRYDVQQAVQSYRAISDDVAFITQLLGTQTVFALRENIAEDDLPTLGATLAAEVIPFENVWITQTPFALEAINGVSWASEEQAGDDGQLQLGVIYQGDAYGEGGLAAVEYAAEQLDNVEVVATASYATTDEDFTPQVQAMRDGGAEVVWLHDTPRQTGAILGLAAQQGFQPLFMGPFSSFASALVEPLGELLNNYRVVNSNASWGEDVPEMERMLDAVEQYAPQQQPDNALITGWISGMITQAALERACENGDLSRQGIIEAMNGLEVDLNGIAPDVSYGATPQEEIPARQVRVNEIDLESTFPVPVTDYFVSEAAEAWTLPTAG